MKNRNIQKGIGCKRAPVTRLVAGHRPGNEMVIANQGEKDQRVCLNKANQPTSFLVMRRHERSDRLEESL